MPGVLLKQKLAEDLRDLLRDSRRDPPSSTTHLPPGPGGRPPIRGILLEDLVDGGEADCAVTERVTTNETQEVEIVGDAVSGGTFKLTYKGQTTTAIPFNATAAQMQTALQALPAIGANNVTVTLGKGTFTNDDTQAQTLAFPGLWLIQFAGSLAGQTNLPLLTATPSLQGGPAVINISPTTHWADTGVVETMNAIIPVGTPTPMRAGAVASGIWYPGIGYGCIACECRQFTVTYF